MGPTVPRDHPFIVHLTFFLLIFNNALGIFHTMCFYSSQWLVQSAEAIFIGFKDGYISMTDDQLLYTVDTNIHHVEHFGKLSENFEKGR